VVKSQIHAGGRGKGKFLEKEAGEKGGVRLGFSKEQALEHVKAMLGNTLVTAQTGAGGKQVNRIYIEDGADIEKELGYLGMAGIFLLLGVVLFVLAKIWRQPREPAIVEAMPEFRPAWLEARIVALLPYRRPLLAGAIRLGCRMAIKASERI
jgi:hypothetical protein